MTENATLDYAAGIDQSLEAILKSTKKMKECLEVSGATAFPPDVVASITESCRSLLRLKAGSETLKSAVVETTDQVKEAAAELAEEEQIPDAENGLQVDVPDGRDLLTQKLDAVRELTDAQIDQMLVMKQLKQALTITSTSSPVPSSQSRSPTKRPGRRSTARNADMSGDLEELQQEESIPIDPFNKKAIEFAVRNKICKHVYDRAALDAYLKQSKNPRCPNIGCVNRQIMTQASVEVDEETNSLIERLKN